MNLTMLKSNDAGIPETERPVISVLVVEDERIIARGIEICLRRLGYHLAGSAANGSQAVAMAGELRPDVVLMDISLGAGMDGIEASDIIRRQYDLPVVFLTANSDDATFRRAVCSDPFGYVRKPFEQKDLQTAVEIAVFKHRMQRRLRENQQWLAATLAGISDAVIAINPEGIIRFINEPAVRMLGVPGDRLTGVHIDGAVTLYDEEKKQRVTCPLRPGEAADGRPITPVFTLVGRGDQQVLVELTITGLEEQPGGPGGSVIVIRDVTRRRLMEKQLRQAQKLESIGRLAGGIADDFNNIMAIIGGYTQLLQDVSISAETRAGYVAEIAAASRNATELVRQITAFGRRQILEPVNITLNEVVADVETILRGLLGERIDVLIQADAAPSLVRADPTQIGRAILSLAANARDAMPDGGTLRISVSSVEIGESQALPGELAPGRHALLTMSDTGEGIAPDQLDKIFEPFFTTKEIGAGVGLGLSTVHGIVKQSGGHVEASSVPGQGATFKIFLPEAARAGHGTAARVPDSRLSRVIHTSDKSPGTILVVDDEAPVRRMVKMLLEYDGFEVIDAVSANEAIALLEANPFHVDLMITDLIMPGMSGRELAERVRAMRPGIGVLFISGYSAEIIDRQGISTAGLDFLQKPFPIELLRARVEQMLPARMNP